MPCDMCELCIKAEKLYRKAMGSIKFALVLFLGVRVLAVITQTLSTPSNKTKDTLYHLTKNIVLQQNQTITRMVGD